MKKHTILVNLPPDFFTQKELKPVFSRLRRLGRLRQRSHNTPEEIRADLAWAEAVLMWSWPSLSDEILAHARNLRFRGHLDISQEDARTALARGQTISLAKHAWSSAVAEMALTLALSLLRRVSDYHAAMRKGKEPWVRSLPGDINPLERQLTGRAAGIIGFGAIGQRLAELLSPFQCHLRVYDPFIPEKILRRHGAHKAALPDLLKKSDVIILCAASNPATRHLLGRREISAMRPNAIFVNVARAALVDTRALVQRLKRNDLFAAIDVFDKEPLQKSHPLRKLPNAYLTPHRAGGLIESVVRILTWLADDLEAFLCNKPLKHPLRENMIPALDG